MALMSRGVGVLEGLDGLRIAGPGGLLIGHGDLLWTQPSLSGSGAFQPTSKESVSNHVLWVKCSAPEHRGLQVDL